MGAIKVPTNFNIELEFEIPEFYRRLVSLIIDMVLEFCYIWIIVKVMGSLERNSSYDNDSAFNLQALFLILMLPLMVYHVVMEVTMNGQSIGKRVMGLRVVNENGGKASISQFIIRWLLRISDLWMVLLLFAIARMASQPDGENAIVVLCGLAFLITDVILVVSSKKGQRIGDILAHTILIRANTRSSIEETVFQEVADSYVPLFPQIMQLSDRDINAIKSILETARKKGDYTMAMNASDKIKSHLHIETHMSPFDFLEVLLKDYNYLSTK